MEHDIGGSVALKRLFIYFSIYFSIDLFIIYL